MINSSLDINSEETDVAEEELVSIKNDTELKPELKKNHIRIFD